MSTSKKIFELSELLSDLSYQQFQNLVWDITISNNRFKNSIISKFGKDSSYDLYADEITENETKSVAFQIHKSDLLTPDYINKTYNYWIENQYLSPSKLIIVTPGTLTNESLKKAKELGIEIWDIYEIFKLITPDIESKYLKLESDKNFRIGLDFDESRESLLILKLESIEKGKKSWSSYQKLSGEIFTHLFCPPLSSPRFEYSDAERRNRRDMIFENSSDHIFWKSIRDKYKGDYIVVDAKNYAKEINKHPIIEIAHYLKPYGCGMFGIILTRIGITKAAENAIREQWIGNNKLIIILNDNDLIEMLNIKLANGKPEEIIKMKISDFRMSL